MYDEIAALMLDGMTQHTIDHLIPWPLPQSLNGSVTGILHESNLQYAKIDSFCTGYVRRPNTSPESLSHCLACIRDIKSQ